MSLTFVRLKYVTGLHDFAIALNLYIRTCKNTLHLEVRIYAGAPHTVICTDFQFCSCR